MKRQPKKKRLMWGDVMDRLKAGDPEIIEAVNEILKIIKELGENAKDIKGKPYAKALMMRLDAVKKHDDPFYRTIGKNISIDSFMEMLIRTPDEIQIFSLPLNPKEDDTSIKVQKMADKGITQKDIAKALWLSVSTVKRVEKKLGIKRYEKRTKS